MAAIDDPFDATNFPPTAPAPGTVHPAPETLAQWAARTGHRPTTEAGAVTVTVSVTDAHRPDAFHLTDYAVSTVSGPVLWLTPRRPRCQHCRTPLAWDAPSGVCSEACLRAAQGFRTVAEEVSAYVLIAPFVAPSPAGEAADYHRVLAVFTDCEPCSAEAAVAQYHDGDPAARAVLGRHLGFLRTPWLDAQ